MPSALWQGPDRLNNHCLTHSHHLTFNRSTFSDEGSEHESEQCLCDLIRHDEVDPEFAYVTCSTQSLSSHAIGSLRRKRRLFYVVCSSGNFSRSSFCSLVPTALCGFMNNNSNHNSSSNNNKPVARSGWNVEVGQIFYRRPAVLLELVYQQSLTLLHSCSLRPPRLYYLPLTYYATLGQRRAWRAEITVGLYKVTVTCDDGWVIVAGCGEGLVWMWEINRECRICSLRDATLQGSIRHGSLVVLINLACSVNALGGRNK